MLCSKSAALLVLFFFVSFDFVACTLGPRQPNEKSSSKKLSRKKRYIAFPEGSSLSASICLTIGMIGNPNVDYISWAENWGVAYDLPNYTWAIQNAHGYKGEKFPEEVIKRRSRRSLYEKIETAINSFGFDGSACIARALCESSKHFYNLRNERGNMIEEIVKTIFSLPSQPVLYHESEEIKQYHRIYHRARRNLHEDCSAKYACHFSLLDLALGKYTVNSDKHTPSANIFPHNALKFM